MKMLFIIVIFGCLSFRAFGAEFQLQGLQEDPWCGGVGAESCISVTMTGEIVKGDSQRLKEAISTLNSVVPEELKKPISVGYLYLDSRGGDVHEAIKIGELVRSELLSVQVAKDSVCYSACVVVLVGGVQRFPFGSIGIHSFYSEDILGEADYEQASKRYDSVSSDLEAYLRKMRIPASLLDDMKKVSHNSIKILNVDELEAYSIFGFDPVYRQMRDGK